MSKQVVSPAIKPYGFRPGRVGILAEVYFPKKVIYRQVVDKTLEEGLRVKIVKKYLLDEARSLLIELAEYPANLFDPGKYRRKDYVKREVTLSQAERRIRMYRSPFYGWSLYEAEGVFLGKRSRMYEEPTQVVRLVFRFPNARSIERKASDAHCGNVVKATISWCLEERWRLGDVMLWSQEQQDRFLSAHHFWPESHKAFAKEYFPALACEVVKWVDDTGLFIFGYLVRNFWEKIQERGKKEEEIWVTSFMPTINVVKQIPRHWSTSGV